MRIRHARLYGIVGREVSYCVRVHTACPTQNSREQTTFVTTAAAFWARCAREASRTVGLCFP